jgi:N-acetylmuramoyl-L-alanine amidase
MRLVPCPSPNFNQRRPGAAIDIVLLHYTGMATAAAALARLTDPAAQVSAHYTLDEDGTVYVHLDEKLRAWHAGQSFWAGERDVNSRSVGIELVNPGHELGYRPFPEAQIAALIELAADIVARHGMARHRVLGHSDVAPRRKQDPGELFPWRRLADAGLGVWPTLASGAPPAADARRVAADLAAIGYDCPTAGPVDPAVIAAFQRRYRPARIDGAADGETASLAAALRRMLPPGGP